MLTGISEVKEALANLRRATVAREPDKSPELWNEFEDILDSAAQILIKIKETEQGYVAV